MSKNSTKATFQVSGKIHKQKFTGYDVWEKNTCPVVKGEKQEMQKTFVLTRKEYRPHPGYNVMVDMNVEVSTHDNIELALNEAKRLESLI